jgi:hypothetical protein
MKKCILIFTLVTFASLLILNFATYKTTDSKQIPISSITNANEGFVTRTMNIDNENHIVKVKMENEFFLVKDPNIGIPDGSFTLTTKKNVFGFTKYEAHDVRNEGV